MALMERTEPLFTFKQGDHTCVFYWDLEGLLEVLTPYIAEGLRSNERCFCAQRPETLAALRNDLRYIGVDVEDEQRRGALELHAPDEVYFREQRFDPDSLLQILENSIYDAEKRGFSGFRTAGELSWAVEGRDECDRLIEYEHSVQKLYPGKPVMGLCLYPITMFDREVLDRVVLAHGTCLDQRQSNPTKANLELYWPRRRPQDRPS
jgi:hypothetical protein